MAGRIPQSDIDEVLTRISIVDVVSDYVALKSSGNGEFKGLCPFHSEKSPSFGVSVTKNLWHCFGCGEGGNLFQFLNKIDSLTFVEAMEKLAAKVGYQLHYEEGRPDDGSSAIRARVLEANTATAAFFQAQLETADAEPGREFLKQRGFDKAAADKFGVGWAPKGWTNLSDHLKTLGFTEDELVTAALASKRDNGGVYDKFRGRLIWPIRDAANAVIGFGARKIFSDDEGPKYLNTSETPVYHKSQVLYGIDLAKRDMGKLQQVVVVEGYTDVMACHLAGISTAVATCGTAFGDEHVKVIRATYKERRDVMLETMEEIWPAGTHWTKPQGGMFLWGVLPAGMMVYPTKFADLDANGNVKAGQVTQILSYLQAFGEQGYRANMDTKGRKRMTSRTGYAYFVGKPKGKIAGIWKRVNFASGSAVVPIFYFIPSPTYRPRLDFYGVAKRVYEARFFENFRSAMRTAVETAR
jgi:DNA primase catalytic core